MGRIFYLSPAGDFLADIVATRCRADGHVIALAETVPTDKSPVNGQFDLVVADAAHPDAWGLCAAVKRHSPQTRVLMLVSESALRPTDFRFEGDRTLVEPFEVADMVTAARELVAETSTNAHVGLAFPTTDEHVERARGVLEHLINHLLPFDEPTRFHLLTAYGEALGNAALHGNKSRRDRLVRVDFRIAPDPSADTPAASAGLPMPKMVTVTIADEGPGFDWRQQFTDRSAGNAIEMARARQAEGKLGGLGFNLMANVCDSVEFNDTGTAITLKKRLPPPAES